LVCGQYILFQFLVFLQEQAVLIDKSTFLPLA
jgi:hypothetical protein